MRIADRSTKSLGVIDRFRERAAQHPDRVAVVCDDHALTFAELDDRSTRMAAVLARAGVRRDVGVAIHLERSLDLVIGLLGVMKAGGAYLPLDRAQPVQRIARILEEARVDVVIADRALTYTATIVQGDAWKTAESMDLAVVVEPDALAYVIFTSGSTGVPKGVEIPHRALTNLLSSMEHSPGFTEDDVLLAVTTISFDIAGLEMFLPLVTGGRLVIATGRTVFDGVRLAKLIDDAGTTVFQATPATWRMLFAAGWRGKSDLKALCGGEALSSDLARMLRAATGSLWNMYGPTETTIWSTVDEVGDGPISIGRPIANTRCYVLDEHHAPVAEGELYIAGMGLARGYVHRPDLTAERFVVDPFHPNERMYKTGDLARWLPDGRLEHLGRLDFQVKIRGYRIELGEIEVALRQHPAVRDAVVVANTELAQPRLIAYLQGDVPLAEIRAHLRAAVPEYMVPAAFVIVDAFPLTSSGKIDRKRLPAPTFEPVDAVLEPPGSALEAELMQIWCDVLRVSRFDRNAEFSRLGGDSLLATHVLSRIRGAYGLQLPIDVMFDAPTIPGVARAIEQLRESARDVPIIARHESSGPTVQVQRYFVRLNAIDPAISIAKEHVSWRISGPLEPVVLARAIRSIIERHEILRTNFAGDRQIVRPAAPPFVLDLEHEVAVGAVAAAATPFVERTFDVEHGEVVRAKLIRVADEDHVLVVSMHHAVFDYASWFIFAEELGTAYRGLRAGATTSEVARSLGALPFQFVDVASRLDAHAESPAGQAALEFWRRKLEGAPPVLLPTDHPRDPVDAARVAAQGTGSHIGQYSATFPAGVVTVSAGPEFARPAIELIETERVSPLTLLLTGLAALLHGATGQTDLAFNTNVGTRPFLRADALIGPFHSPTFVRVDLARHRVYRDLLAALRRDVVDMLGHATVPVLERVSHHVGRVGFGFFGLNVPTPVLDLGAARTVILPSWPSHRMDTHFDFWPMLDLRSSGLTVHFIYNQRLFERKTVERLAARYIQILRTIIAAPDTAIDARATHL